MPSSNENLKKYKEMLVARGYEKLVPPAKMPTDLNLLMLQLAREGQELLDHEELANCHNSLPVTSAPSKSLENALGKMDKNPYIRARTQILGDMPKGRRERIEEMERTGKLENNEYQEFVRMVRKLGDSFSK